MTTNPPDRLDRIENILEALAVRQSASQHQLDQMREEFRLRTEQLQADLQANITDVVSMIGSLAGDLDALNAQVNAFIAQSTAFLAAEQRDRSEFRQQMVGLQTEARNILRELADLRRQQSNGGQ